MYERQVSTPEVEGIAAGTSVLLGAACGLDNAGRQAGRRVCDIDRLLLEHVHEFESDCGRGRVNVDLQDGQYQANGCHRQQQLKQQSFLVAACARASQCEKKASQSIQKTKVLTYMLTALQSPGSQSAG